MTREFQSGDSRKFKAEIGTFMFAWIFRPFDLKRQVFFGGGQNRGSGDTM